MREREREREERERGERELNQNVFQGNKENNKITCLLAKMSSEASLSSFSCTSLASSLKDSARRSLLLLSTTNITATRTKGITCIVFRWLVTPRVIFFMSQHHKGLYPSNRLHINHHISVVKEMIF